MTGRRALVVGGTGPTGPAIVNRLLAAGYETTIYHSGAHEVDFDSDVEHLHGDNRDGDDIAAKLAGREWEVAILTSGRLRALANELAGRCGRLVGITGQPVYRGAVVPTPEGLIALPVPEWAERQSDRPDYTGKVAAGEDQLMQQHGRGDFEAAIVRYPGVYGARGPLAHEWAVVKRVLDDRPAMIMPGSGTSYFQRGYAENLGQLVFLAATRPEAAGEAFNGADERVLNARHVAQLILDELNHEMDLVGIPPEFCRGFYPLAQKSSLILDMSKARTLLGYRDVVDPETATRLTARWLAEHRPTDVAPAFAGSFDYEAEDRLIESWKTATADLA